MGGAHTDVTPRHVPREPPRASFCGFGPRRPVRPRSCRPSSLHFGSLLALLGCSVRDSPFTTSDKARDMRHSQRPYSRIWHAISGLSKERPPRRQTSWSNLSRRHAFRFPVGESQPPAKSVQNSGSSLFPGRPAPPVQPSPSSPSFGPARQHNQTHISDKMFAHSGKMYFSDFYFSDFIVWVGEPLNRFAMVTDIPTTVHTWALMNSYFLSSGATSSIRHLADLGIVNSTVVDLSISTLVDARSHDGARFDFQHIAMQIWTC